MNYSKFSINTSDNLKLFGQKWFPDDSIPKAIILIVHGMGEHSSKYEHVARYFTEKNFGIISYDHRGHGRSEGKRGYIPNYEYFLEDLDIVFKHIVEEYVDKDIFMYAHSMGGNIGMSYLMRKDNGIKSAIISSPWLELANPAPKLLYNFGKIMYKVYPRYTIKGSLEKNMKENGQSEESILARRSNELEHDDMSAQLFFDCENAGKWILGNSDKLQTEILLMHGTKDNTTSFDASKRFGDASENTIFKAWDGFEHELHNDEKYMHVLDYVYKFLEKYI